MREGVSMFTQFYSVPINQRGQKLLDRGTPLFPLEIYYRDVHQYIGNEITAHWHKELEIFVLEKGEVRVSGVDYYFDLEAGDAYLINSNILHGVSCLTNDPCVYRSIVFDSTIISGTQGSIFDILYMKSFLENGTPIRIFKVDTQQGNLKIVSEFNRAYAACEKKYVGYEFHVRDALSQILLRIYDERKSHLSRTSTQQENRMKKMILWIDKHYNEQITVALLANIVGIGVRECQRYFSNLLQVSPIQYVTRRRITAAAELLLATNISVTEIGMDCGFKSSSYFTKQFKVIMGLTPRKYRNLYQRYCEN